MKALITAIISALGTKLGQVLLSLANVAVKVLSYLEAVRKDNKEKEQREKIEKQKEKIDDVCDNGTIEDLVNI